MSIGSTYQTGQIAPLSGVYKNMTHSHSRGQDEIPLSKGDRFPDGIRGLIMADVPTDSGAQR